MQKMDHEKSDEYTEFLCSLGLAGLDAESNRLTTNQTNLTELSQELALNYYPSFIATNECVKNLLSDVCFTFRYMLVIFLCFSYLRFKMKVKNWSKTFPNFAIQ